MFTITQLPTVAAAALSVTLLCSSARAQSFSFTIFGVVEDDVPVIDLVAGDEAALEFDVDFSGVADVNPDPTITVINDAPGSDLGLDIGRPPVLEWRDDG